MTSGVWKVAPNVAECCKTFHEYEPWLEVDMLALYHLKYVYRPNSGRRLSFIDTMLELTFVPGFRVWRRSVRVLHRIEPRGDPRVYRLTPFWVILSRTPILAQDLHEARKRGVYAFKVCAVLYSPVLLVGLSRGRKQEEDNHPDVRMISDLTSPPLMVSLNRWSKMNTFRPSTSLRTSAQHDM